MTFSIEFRTLTLTHPKSKGMTWKGLGVPAAPGQREEAQADIHEQLLRNRPAERTYAEVEVAKRGLPSNGCEL